MLYDYDDDSTRDKYMDSCIANIDYVWIMQRVVAAWLILMHIVGMKAGVLSACVCGGYAYTHIISSET